MTMEKHAISRRSFLKCLGAAGATGLAATTGGLTSFAATRTPASHLTARYGGTAGFAADIESRYAKPSIEDRSEVRWWMAEGAHTDETLLEELHAMYDAGFRGLELCEQNDGTVDEKDYGYGSDQWDHDMRLVMNEALDLGMTVSLTSGTNWSTANIPGLDPDSAAASQVVFEIHETLEAGQSRSGLIPMEKTVSYMSWGQQITETQVVKEKAAFVGAYAYKQVEGDTAPTVFATDVAIDLSGSITTDAEGKRSLDWTAPADGTYYVFYYWQQGAYQTSNPAIAPSYCINYFDEAGVDALKDYWSAHILNDPALNAKIKKGDVQLFMDSLEINAEDGITFWCDDMAEQFRTRKGYDIRPYLYLFIGLPEMWFFKHNGYGTYDMSDGLLRTRIQNDLYDVQNDLYVERMLRPIKKWMNSYGIKTRAQITYGQRLEISEPIMDVDYPEAENLNQNNQPDIYRLWSGGAKLQNKVLSAETGAVGGYQYGYTVQQHLMEAYSLYSAGFSRIIWHIWSSQFGPGENTKWPGYEVSGFMGSMFYDFGTREPSSVDYDVFNDHLGRVQQLLREGVSRTDVGMLYIQYDQGMPTSGNSGGVNWLLNHEEALFPSTVLQDNGYTYDYFSPAFLTADGVSYNCVSHTLEKAGYKALVLWQDQLPVEGAQSVLKLAKKGMPVVIVDGAAVRTPYNDGRDAELSAVIDELRAQASVRRAAAADDVYSCLQAAGVEPYVGFAQANRQLLTQCREADGNRYLYVYNYCDGTYQSFWSNGEVQDTHGDHCTAELVADGIYVPFQIDAWTGKTTQLGSYRVEDGKTYFTVDLDYNNVALYALKKITAPVHIVSGNVAAHVENGELVARLTETTETEVALSDGRKVTVSAAVPDASDITGWDVTVESWTEGSGRDRRTETLFGKTIVETSVQTEKTPISVHLDTLTTWDNIPEVGRSVSGQATYQAQFQWDGRASGAYINFGELTESMTVTINGTQTGDLNLITPVLDIKDYLVEGTNTIELHYSSNLTNVQLARGAKREGDLSGWYGYSMKYHSYGPAQAVLVPYVDAVIE